MSIRSWTDDYVSGFNEIDLQHRTLFSMINTFASENNERASNSTSMAFLGDLAKYCDYHFTCEEEVMAEYDYPLIAFHKDIHINLTNTVKKIIGDLSKNAMKDPYTTIISFSADWLNNHIARDDLSFLSFYKNRDYDLSENFLGKQCSVSKLNNDLIGMGRIKSVFKNEVIIEHKAKKRLPLELNDMVKVSTSSSLSSIQMFIAKVYYSGPEEIRLFNATVIMTLNRRKFFRVTTDIEAVLWLDDKSYPVTIVNLGAGGVLINSQQPIDSSQQIKLEFVVENKQFSEVCKEIHVEKRVGVMNIYGLEFTDMQDAQQDKLINYAFNRQTLLQRSKA